MDEATITPPIPRRIQFWPRTLDSNALITFCFYLLILALWLSTRPYLGIIHDSRFYTLQALNALMPGQFAEDLYFRYGSQDQFTIFTLLYKPVMVLLGGEKANIILTIVSQFFWLCGLFYLARSLFRDQRIIFIAVAAVILLPGGTNFKYGETFLTPRVFAEALTFFALGSMLRGKSIRAFLLLCISMTLHPLMTLPGLAVLFFHEASKRRALWWLAGLAIIVVFGMAFGGIQPFARLLVSFDPAWFAIVKYREAFCFISEWTPRAWMRVGNTLALTALVLTVSTPNENKFLKTVIIVVAGACFVSIIGADMLHNVLIADVQLYRAIWLLAVITHLFVGASLLRIQLQGKFLFTSAVFLSFLATGLIALSSYLPDICFVAMPMAAFACIIGWREHIYQEDTPYYLRITILSCIGMLCWIAMAIIQSNINQFAIWPTKLGLIAHMMIKSAVILCAFCGCLKLDKTSHKRGGVPAIAMLCVAILLPIVAALDWDQRVPWRKLVDSGSPPPALTALLPGDSPIYWEGDTTAPWFLLKRQSYFSCLQGTGAIFSRGTAMEYQRLYDSFKPLETLDFKEDPFCIPHEGSPIVTIQREDLLSLCKREPKLGALVLTKEVMNAVGHEWRSPVKFEMGTQVDGKLQLLAIDRFFIYHCSNL